MAAYSYGFAISSCSATRPSASNKSSHFNASLSSSIKAYVKQLPQLPKLKDIGQGIKETSVKLVDAVADLTFEFVDQPLHPSQSNFAPVEEIGGPIEVVTVEGCIPHDFPEGVYIRNGGNPYFGSLKTAKSVFGKSSSAWVEGEGMLHALNFKKHNSGEWNILYNNKYVQTESLKIEKERNRPVFLPAAEGDSLAVAVGAFFNMLRFGDANKVLSNTSIFGHSGKFYSSTEASMPQEVDVVTLETVGEWDLLYTSWNRRFTSHPKKAPTTGELIFSGVETTKPYLMIGIMSADGKKIIHKADMQLERCIFCHEIGVTERYNIILDFPLTIDINRLLKGGPLIKYEKDQIARIGVMPRYGDADSTRWFEVEKGNAFHIFNCFEDGDEVVIMGCKARASILPGPDFGADKFEWFSRSFKPINSLVEDDDNSIDGSLFTRAYQWRVNLKTGKVKERYLTGIDFSMDFPLINENFVGLKNHYGYTQVVDSIASSNAGMPKYGGLAKLYFNEKEHAQSLVEDMAKVEYHRFPENTFGTGAVFVPKPGGIEEDDGWVISFVHNESKNISQVYIIDAKDISSEPIAKIGIPVRVPYGFHGAFFAMNSEK